MIWKTEKKWLRHRQTTLRFFRRQKYQAEGQSTGQIAAQIFSGRSTVSKYLKAFDVVKKPANPSRKGQLAFSEKAVEGKLRKQMTETDAIKAMMWLRTEGFSFLQIAAWLDGKRLPL